MQFARPTMFWLLALAPALVLFLVWAFRARQNALTRVAAPPLAEKLAASVNRAARRWKAVFLVGAVMFAVLALAQPRWGFEWREVKHRGVDIFVLLDVSKSMLAEDVRPNRLTQAKFAVKDLLHKLEGDRIGLIAFAGTAFVQCPLTVDYEAFRMTLNDADPRVIPRGGSAIGQAIRTALKGFEAGEGRDRAIILITDGEDTEGNPASAAEEAAQQGVKIYPIGVGTSDGELIPLKEEGKSLEFVKDSEGKVVKSRLNEEPLRELAARTQGIYVRSVPGNFGLDAIYDQGIRQLQRKEFEAKLQKRFFERYQWPLGVALVLLLLEMFVSDRRRSRDLANPRIGESANGRKQRQAAMATVSSLVVLCSAGVASADTASRLFERGRYDEALARYKKAAEKETENWPLFYNLGASAYKAGQLEEAAKAFGKSLGSPDRALQAKAFYNLGNTSFRVGEATEAQGPAQAIPAYENSLKAFENALAIDPNDEDAKFNRNLAKKKIEELKKQQQEQQQQQQQDQKQEQEDDKKDQKQDEPQNQPQQQQQPKEQKPEEQEDSQPQAQDPSKPEPRQPQADSKPQPSGAMTNNFDRVRAAALLDNLREEEKNWNFFPELQMDLKDPGLPEKDW